MEISRRQAFRSVFCGRRGVVVLVVVLLFGVIGRYDDVRSVAPFLPEPLNIFTIIPSFVWFVLGLLIIAYIVFEGAYQYMCLLLSDIKDKTLMPTVLTKPKKYLRANHSLALSGVTERMESIHGHSDPDGLRAEAKDGVLISDLLSRNCTRCGKPRNQKGDFVL